MTRCKAPQRRQARSIAHRAATGGLMLPAHRSPLPPRTPHPRKTGPGWGCLEGSGGQPIAKTFAGGRRVCGKPVDTPLCNLVTPRGCKKNPSTGLLQIPRVGLFYPRVALVFPRVGFGGFVSLTLSLSLFSLVKKRERGTARAKAAIHGFLKVKKNDPRVSYQKSSYSVDEMGNPWATRPYKSTTCSFIHGNPRSTGKNAYALWEKVRNGR